MAELPLTVARARDGTWRARPVGPGAGVALIELLVAGGSVPDGFRLTGADARPVAATERRFEGIDQTNESWVVGEAAVVKWATEPLAGPHPAPERLRRLRRAGFRCVPALWGLVEWRTPAGHWVPVATVTELLAGARDGWSWCVAEACAALGVAGAGAPAPFAGRLGALVAEMHLALADEPAPAASARYARAALAGAEAELAAVASPSLEPLRPRARRALAALGAAAGTPLIAVHGDLHVGQVLRDAAGDLFVVDFDGNPTLAPEERAAWHPAAVDVAGVLVSLENVGLVVARHVDAVSDDDARAWSEGVQAEFLGAYRDRLARAGRPALLDESLLEAYTWRQIARELAYAASHLPDWAHAPEGALRRRLVQET